MVRLEDINYYKDTLNLKRVKIITPDGPSNYIRDILNKMDKNTFNEFIKYHLNTCERKDMIGAAAHTLDILKKEIENGNRYSLEDFIENTILYENFIELDYLINDFRMYVNEQIYNKCCNEIKALTNQKMMPYDSFVKYVQEGRKNYIYQIGRLKSILIDTFKLEESNIIFEKYF